MSRHAVGRQAGWTQSPDFKYYRCKDVGFPGWCCCYVAKDWEKRRRYNSVMSRAQGYAEDASGSYGRNRLDE